MRTVLPARGVEAHGAARRFAAAAVGAGLVGMAAGLGGCSDEPPQGGAVPVKVVLGSLGDSPGRFAYPRAIAADEEDETLWVVDKSARIQQLDPETGDCLAIWRMPLSEKGKPVGITLGPTLAGDAGVWVPDTHYHRVMVFPQPGASSVAASNGSPPDSQVQPVATFGEFGTGPGQFIYPTDVALLTGAQGQVERVYVAEYGGNDRVSVFDRHLQFLFSFGAFGYGGEGEEGIFFDRPQAIEVDAHRRELVVVDSRNHRLGRFTLEGDLIGWIGSPETSGSAPGQLKYPYGLALLGDGTALVAEYGNNRVQRLDLETGESLGVWGTPGRGEGELATPWAITTLGRRTFVLDSGNNRVLGMTTPALIESAGREAADRGAGLALQRAGEAGG